MVLFLSPLQQELRLACGILHVFEGASGLGCNIAKCQLAPIRCSKDQVNMAVTIFPYQKVDFSIKHLGLPLSTSKLPKLALQPLADRVADKQPAWKGGLLHSSGRLTLIKMTLCVVPIYTSISVSLPGWLLKAIQRIMKAFLWSGTAVVQNGACIMSWSRVQRPLSCGGLEMPELKLLGIALGARWLWLHHADMSRSWVSLPSSEDAMTVAFFNASIQM
jgi:hypothetical protein